MKKHDYLMLLSVLTLLASIGWYVQQGLDEFQEGQRDIELGNFQSAADKFTQITLDKPGDAQAFNDLGVAYHHLKEYDKAIENYTKAIELHPDYIKAIGNRGISKNDKGDYEGALIDYDKVINLDPDYENYYNNRGVTNKSLRHYEEAIKNFKKAHQLNPEISKAVGNLAETYKELGDCGKVIEWSTYYVEHYPPRKKAYRLRAQCKEQIGDKSGARQDFALADETINQRHPDEPKPFDNRTLWNFAVGTLAFLASIGIFISLKMRTNYLASTTHDNMYRS